MSTEVRGSNYNSVAPYYYYDVARNNETEYLLSISAGTIATNYPTDIGGGYRIRLAGTGKTAQTSSRVRWTDTTPGRYSAINAGLSWTKTHLTQSVTVTATLQTAPASSTDYTNRTTATKTFSIPAKTSYSVTYNANGGSGAPSAQTKWYGESLTLSSTKPSMSGYTFKGWATSKANANNGSVTYAAGATYSSNAALALYAVWELNHTNPSITNVSIERCDANGDMDDEGGYAKVTFDWSILKTSATRYYGGSTTPYANNSASYSVTVGTESESGSLTGASDTEAVVVGDGSFDTDAQYNVSVSVTDSPVTGSGVTALTTTVSSVLSSANFPIDINSNGTAIGLLRTAPDNDTGLFVGGGITVENHGSKIGTVLSAAWTATSSAASTTNLTDEITLTAGTWVIVITLPSASRTHQYMLTNLSSFENKYWSEVSMGTITCIHTVTSTTTTRVRSAATTSVTFSNTERGHLEAVRIA